MASSTLAVAEVDTDAPNTAMADTRRDADHEGRCRLGGAPRAAHGVLPSELARYPERPRQGAPDRAGERACHGWGKHGGTDEDRRSPEPYERDRRRRKAYAEQATTDDGHCSAPCGPVPVRGLAASLTVADGGDGRDPHCPARWADRGDDSNADPYGQRDHQCPGLEHQRPRRQREPERAEERLEPHGSEHTKPGADERGDDPHNGGLAEHRTGHLAAAGTNDPQQGQLSRPLPDGVMEIVKAPTNSDMNANTSSAVEKNESDWLIELVCSSSTVWPVTTSTPCGRARAMARSTAGLLAPGLATTLMSFELALLSQDLLRGRQGEGGERDARQVVSRSELGDPADGEHPREALQQRGHGPFARR